MIGTKVLIVDDDRELVALVARWLRQEGIETCAASDTIQGQMQARKERPDLILLDIGLPGGDGFVALDRLQKNVHTAGVPVLVLSAKSADEAAAKALAAGACAYVEKAAGRTELIAAIRNALEPEAVADAIA